jgi:hypothetical protein
MDGYLKRLMEFGSDYAYRQLARDLARSLRVMSPAGRERALAALIGFASR